MKKILSFLLIVMLIATTLLVGCGKNAKSGTANTNTVPNKSTATSSKVKLVIWHYWDGQQQRDALQKLIDKFNASQDKIEVSSVFIPRTELTKQLTMGVVANKLPDIAIVDNPDMASFASMGIFAEITDKVAPIKNEFYTGPISSCELNGKYYGVPFGSNDLALFYNKDMLSAENIQPPTTWDELKIAAKKLTKPGITYGLAIAAPKNDEGTFQFLPWLLSTGAKFNEIDSPQGIKALSYLTDLIKDHSMSGEVINWTQNDLEKQFVTKKAAMIVDGPWIINTIKSDAPSLNWGVVKIPKDKIFSSVLGGENWGIIKGPHEAEAWQFIKFTEQKNIMIEYAADFGFIPPIKDIAENDDAITKDPVMSVFLDELQYAMPRGPHPKWPQISDAISTAMQESFTQIKTPEQAAKDAQVKIDSIIK